MTGQNSQVESKYKQEDEWVWYEEREGELDRYHQLRDCAGDDPTIAIIAHCDKHGGVLACNECVGDNE